MFKQEGNMRMPRFFSIAMIIVTSVAIMTCEALCTGDSGATQKQTHF
jgi:hypothetical protein